MHQRRRPGYAVAGTANAAQLVLDLVENDLDGKLTRALVPPGALRLSESTLHALLAWTCRSISSLWHDMLYGRPSVREPQSQRQAGMRHALQVPDIQLQVEMKL